jgi:hypothetical protein
MALVSAPCRGWPRPDRAGRSRPHQDMKKPPVATPGAAPFQEASLSSAGGPSELIQASTAEQYQATRQALSCIRRGNFPAFSSRAMC